MMQRLTSYPKTTTVNCHPLSVQTQSLSELEHTQVCGGMILLPWTEWGIDAVQWLMFGDDFTSEAW